MRRLAALALAAALAALVPGAVVAAPAKPAPVRDWTKVVAATPDGGYRIGNPDAKVKLIEYASVWCPHCKHFQDEALAPLKSRYIASGKVSYERRDFVLNGPDMLATLLVRCDGLPAYYKRLEAFYARQTEWEENFVSLDSATLAPLQAMPVDQQMPAYAKLAKLDAFAQSLGIPAAHFDRCIANRAEIDRLTESNNRAVRDFNLTATPTFVLNGKALQNTNSWEELEPQLRAAL